MKSRLFPLLASAVVVASSCSKENVNPTPTATLPNDSSWRMAAYTIKLGSRSNSTRSTLDFFRSYSQNAPIPCLGMSTLTFTSAGKIVWAKEANGCGIYTGNYPTSVAADWGTWSTTNAGTKLVAAVTGTTAGQSHLPVMYPTAGGYDLIQADQTTLILGATHIIGQNQDSIQVDQAVFTRVQ